MEDCSSLRLPVLATFFAAEYLEEAAKRSCGRFGTKPDMAWTFISILTLMDAEALAGLAMPARVSAFGSKIYKIVL